MSHRIHHLQQHYAVQTQKQSSKKPAHSFQEVLRNSQKIKVSKHATQRLQESNIKINDQQWKIIGKKIMEAKQKGVTDSLVVINNVALLVSTKNNTVVTAMNLKEENSRLFTNINGTIVIND